MEKTVRYDVNGYIYRFENIRVDGGIEYGYCRRLKKHAWLYPDYIQFEGEYLVRAKRLENG